MKFRSIYFTLLLPLFAACSNKIGSPDSPSRSGRFVLKATFDSRSKTFIKDEYGKIYWSADDAISLFADDLPPVKMLNDIEGETAEFHCEEIPGLDDASEYIGLYPYTPDASLEDGSLFFELPSSQTAVQSSFDPDAFFSVGRSTTAEMGFHNLCGGLRFTVTGSDINRVVFSSNDDDDILSGEVFVDMNDEELSLYPSDGGEGDSSVELTSLQPLTPGLYYYISVIPQLLEEGFTLEFYNDFQLVAHTVCNSPVEICRSSFSTVREADDQASVSRILTGTDLSLDGSCTANSYIVSSPGYYKIPLVKADGTPVEDVSMVSCLWESENTSVRPGVGSCLNVIACRGGYVYFKIPELEGNPGQVKSANAVLSAYTDRGAILWSWHIWICNRYDPELESRVLKGTDFEIMDRNLGALSASPSDKSSFGLLYQWGRSVPFPGAASDKVSVPMATTTTFESIATAKSRGTTSYALYNPVTFITSASDWMYVPDATLWNETKTVYDPCPYGWKVPTATVFGNCAYTLDSTNKGVRISVEGTAAPTFSWFPFCGEFSEKFTLLGAETSGSVWTCSPDGNKSFALNFSKSSFDVSYVANRAGGRPVRCVKE